MTNLNAANRSNPSDALDHLKSSVERLTRTPDAPDLQSHINSYLQLFQQAHQLISETAISNEQVRVINALWPLLMGSEEGATCVFVAQGLDALAEELTSTEEKNGLRLHLLKWMWHWPFDSQCLDEKPIDVGTRIYAAKAMFELAGQLASTVEKDEHQTRAVQFLWNYTMEYRPDQPWKPERDVDVLRETYSLAERLASTEEKVKFQERVNRLVSRTLEIRTEPEFIAYAKILNLSPTANTTGEETPNAPILKTGVNKNSFHNLA